MTGLETLVSHPVVERLGWTLVHFLWQGALVALAVALVLRLLQKASANTRYLVGCLGLGIMVMVPSLTFLRLGAGGTSPDGQSLRHRGPAATVRPDDASASSSPVQSMPSLEGRHAARSGGAAAWIDSLLRWLVAGWLLGVCALLLRVLVGWIQLQRIKRVFVEPLDGAWLERLQSLAKRIGVSRPVRLLKSKLVEVPMAVGWLRPVILLPVSALVGLTPQQLEAILLHELAHIRRFDYLVNLLQTVVETVLFYHPAVWWISRRVRVEREYCCDDLATAACGDALAYAQALTEMEQVRYEQSALALAAVGGELRSRIWRILGKPAPKRPWGRCNVVGLESCALVILSVAAIVLAAWPIRSAGQPVVQPPVELTSLPSFDEVRQPRKEGGWDVPVGPSGRLVFRSKLDPEGREGFRLMGLPAGPVAVAVMPLSEGLDLFVKNSWQTPDLKSDSNSDSTLFRGGRAGRTFDMVRNVLPAPDNWMNLRISAQGSRPHGEYVVCVWQPKHPNDVDADVIGVEATPVVLDESGERFTMGKPVENQRSIEFAGDVDVFQVRCPRAKAVTFTVDGAKSGLAMIFQAYDASGKLIAESESNPRDQAVELTVNTKAGEVAYFAVRAAKPSATGSYVVRVKTVSR